MALLATTSPMYVSMHGHTSSLLLMQDLSRGMSTVGFSLTPVMGFPASPFELTRTVPTVLPPQMTNFHLLHHPWCASCGVPCQKAVLSQLLQTLHAHFCSFATSESLRFSPPPMSVVLLGLCPCGQLRFHCRGMRKGGWPRCKRQDGQGRGTPGWTKDCAQHRRGCPEVWLEEPREKQGSQRCSPQKRKVAH